MKIKVIIMYCYLCVHCVTGEVPMYSPFEFRTEPGEIGANKLSFPNSNFPPRSYHVPQQQIIHAGAMQSQPLPTAGKNEKENPSSSFNEFLNAIKEYSGVAEEENQKLRTTNNVDDLNKFKHSLRQNYDSWTPSVHDSAPLYVPPTTIRHESTDKALPKFNFLEPVTDKMSNKMNGLMGLILALLGSGSNNLFKGFKEVIFDGILKPFLVMKGGLKMLISKIAIPLISLLLINVEVLITVWWLWDDCEKPFPVQYPPPYQPAYQQPVNSYIYNNTY